MGYIKFLFYADGDNAWGLRVLCWLGTIPALLAVLTLVLMLKELILR